MATLREIKRRIKTAKNIGQVTRALEMVSAVKMKKAQNQALSTRPYSLELESMIRNVLDKNEIEETRFLTPPPEISKIALLIVSPQKGLCGPLVSNLTRSVAKFQSHAHARLDISPYLYSPVTDSFAPLKPSEKPELNFVTFGKKSGQIAKRVNGDVVADFPLSKSAPTIFQIRPIAQFLFSLFKEKKADLILVAYSHFDSVISQKAVLQQFLPLIPSQNSSESPKGLKPLTLFEPSAKELFDSLIVRYLESSLFQIVLENFASEHSARMVAMKNARENASEIVSDLTLFYNKARQSAITAELADSISATLSIN